MLSPTLPHVKTVMLLFLLCVSQRLCHPWISVRSAPTTLFYPWTNISEGHYNQELPDLIQGCPQQEIGTPALKSSSLE